MAIGLRKWGEHRAGVKRVERAKSRPNSLLDAELRSNWWCATARNGADDPLEIGYDRSEQCRVKGRFQLEIYLRHSLFEAVVRESKWTVDSASPSGTQRYFQHFNPFEGALKTKQGCGMV